MAGPDVLLPRIARSLAALGLALGGYGCAPARVASEPPVVTSVAAPPGFAICAACHPVSRDGAHGMGPNLRGVVGRKAGSAAGFVYSSALRSSWRTWTPQALDAFLADPQGQMPGNAMPFGGLVDMDQRASIVRYLESLK